jgi:hypothetical protein
MRSIVMETSDRIEMGGCVIVRIVRLPLLVVHRHKYPPPPTHTHTPALCAHLYLSPCCSSIYEIAFYCEPK